VKRLGTNNGPNEQLLKIGLDLGFKVVIGGGISKSHVQSLIEIGASGALLDPFSPEMRDALKQI
jgi:uncharacterized protein related to proFAR isomerase